MKYFLLASAVALITTFAGQVVVNAQSPTPSPSPSPSPTVSPSPSPTTTTPEGAPQTGFGTIGR